MCAVVDLVVLWSLEENMLALVSQHRLPFTLLYSYGVDGSFPRQLYKIDCGFHSSLGFYV